MTPAFDPFERQDRFPILRTLRDRVLVFDGGMGTMIQRATLTLDDFHGKEGCNEILVRTRPDVIEDIHSAYFAAGADVVETNTFGGMPYVLGEFDMADESRAEPLTSSAPRRGRALLPVRWGPARAS